MIEIIQRKHGENENRPEYKFDKGSINGTRAQVSYNSDGHLVVRVLQGKLPGGLPNDTLVVFDRDASDTIISFCRNTIGVNEQFINLVAKHATKLPF